ncbi:MAG: hypothetical protein COA61_002415 [Zetaproteobacteria bacterium]|nr:hypothetical protein [Zetaproteobacteria bacterium]
MTNPTTATKIAPIQICHGQNCRDVGGLSLAEQCQRLGMDFESISCQSLCNHAPTAKLNGVAILRVNFDKILTVK